MPPLRPRPPPKTSIGKDDPAKNGIAQDAPRPAANIAEMPPPPPPSLGTLGSDMDALSAMQPPPNPTPPVGVLEPEMKALSGCLRNAVVKTGQVYGFYADSRKLGIQKYASEPPKALTAALGREVEKYDQLCDAVEAQLLRAITVLQRDLTREQRRLQDADKAPTAAHSRSKSLSQSPTVVRAQLPESSLTGEQMITDTTLTEPPSSGNMSPPPTSGGSASSGGPGRRGSTISLSSLHRPAFPHKLDLSATTLRITAEEASLFSSGPMASPVTLAPRSARPSASNEIPPDFMAAFDVTGDGSSRPVDIDLTVPDTGPSDVSMGNHDMDIEISTTLGNTADKPIELDDDIDLDMSDLFGDTGDTSSNATDLPKDIKQDDMELDLLGALSTAGDADSTNNDIFASFAQSGDSPSSQLQPQGSSSLSVPDALPSTPGAPSPGTILASFAEAEMSAEQPSISTDTNAMHADSFDMNSLDISNAFGAEPESMAEIEELLKSGGFGTAA